MQEKKPTMAREPSRSLLFPRTPARDPGAAPRVANWAVIGIFILMAVGALATARTFLMPVCLGILLFFVFVPFRRWMNRRGVPSGVTAGIVTLGMVLVVVVLGYFVSGPAGQLIDEAPRISRQLQEKYEDFRANFRGIESAAAGLDALTHGEAEPAVVASRTGGGTTAVTTTAPVTAQPGGTAAARIETAVPAVIGATPAQPGAVPPVPARPETGTVTARSTVVQPAGSSAASSKLTVEVKSDETGGSVTETVMMLGPAIASQTLFTLLFLFFLLQSGDLLYLRIVQSFDAMKDKRAAYQALREIEDSLGNYLGAITLINVGLGVATGLAMWAWGMPSPLLWGIAGAVLNYIPYIGAMIGYVGAAVVAVVVFDDAWTSLLVGGTFFALTAIEGQFITPFFVSRRLQLNTVVVFLTVALWAWLWSVLGMIVAVPMLVVIRVLADHIPGLEKFGNFLAGEPPPALEDEGEEGDDAAAAASPQGAGVSPQGAGAPV